MPSRGEQTSPDGSSVLRWCGMLLMAAGSRRGRLAGSQSRVLRQGRPVVREPAKLAQDPPSLPSLRQLRSICPPPRTQQPATPRAQTADPGPASPEIMEPACAPTLRAECDTARVPAARGRGGGSAAQRLQRVRGAVARCSLLLAAVCARPRRHLRAGVRLASLGRPINQAGREERPSSIRWPPMAGRAATGERYFRRAETETTYGGPLSIHRELAASRLG